MGVCQKNCAIDYSKCLVTTFDLTTCSKQEAACALDCLKSTEVAQQVSSVSCTLCKAGARQIKRIIANWGCGTTDRAITLACKNFIGPEDSVADVCAAGFIAACPTLLKWIEGKIFTPTKACTLVRLC